jgi:hypothetical protein
MTRMATYRRGEAESVADEQLQTMHPAVVAIVAIVAIVGTEDYGVAHKVWQSIEHGEPGIPFVLGRNELLVQRDHQEIAERIGMPLS